MNVCMYRYMNVYIKKNIYTCTYMYIYVPWYRYSNSNKYKIIYNLKFCFGLTFDMNCFGFVENQFSFGVLFDCCYLYWRDVNFCFGFTFNMNFFGFVENQFCFGVLFDCCCWQIGIVGTVFVVANSLKMQKC